jgi:hypothetical protein
MGPIPAAEAPAVGIDSAGNNYVYWEGANKHLDQGMQPMGGPPGVAIYG